MDIYFYMCQRQVFAFRASSCFSIKHMRTSYVKIF